MTSCDTNVLFAATVPGDVHHAVAVKFVEAHAEDEDFVLAQQTLVELYGLLRNPILHEHPLSAAEAVRAVDAYRRNPAWKIVDVPENPTVMTAVWFRASRRDFARRRIHDVRLAETLKYHGVRTFYTRNLKDFRDCGFTKLLNPFDE